MNRLCLLVAVVVCAFAQKSVFTNGMVNGRAWQRMSGEMKISHVVGMKEGMIMGCGLGTDLVRLKDCIDGVYAVFPQKFSNSDLLKSLDGFYDDLANTNIPVGRAAIWLGRKYVGEDIGTLSQALVLMRREFNLQ